MSCSALLTSIALCDEIGGFLVRHNMSVPKMLRQDYRGGVLPALRTNTGYAIICNEHLLPIAVVGETCLLHVYPDDFSDEKVLKSWMDGLHIMFLSKFDLKLLREQSVQLLDIGLFYYVYAVRKIDGQELVPPTRLFTLPT